MAKSIFHTSIENAFYFSLATFVLIWIAGFLYEMLDKTIGKLSIGVIILIVLSLALVMFLLALVNIVLSSEDGEKSSFLKRISAILLFAFVSAVILIVLGLIFWYKF